MAADTAVTRSPERSKATRADDDVDQEEDREAKKMKTNLDTEEDADDDDEEELEVPSPIRVPYIPDRLKNRFGMAHPTISAAYRRAETKFLEKRGGEPLAQSAGFWIEWDEGSGTGVVLTTAYLIRAKKPLPKDHWGRKDRYQYHPDALVTVHLVDDTTVDGRLLYHQQHYDLAIFKVAVDGRVQLTSFGDMVNVGQEALWLGREEDFNLRITHGKEVETQRSESVRRGKGVYIPRCDDGGEPVIDFDGKVVGMISGCKSGSFVPSFILNRCMDLWRNFGCIPRPHLGLQFKTLKYLHPTHAEYIWRKLNIDYGLVVQHVSMGSHAEKVGIRVGDIIGHIGGEPVSTTIELENKLLSISMSSFDVGNDTNAKLDVSVRVFRTANCLWRKKHLTVNVSDHQEVVERAYYPIINGERFSIVSSPDQVDSDSDSELNSDE
ncbi:hypothetical protein VPH35_080894 [Triticum aestivum]